MEGIRARDVIDVRYVPYIKSPADGKAEMESTERGEERQAMVPITQSGKFISMCRTSLLFVHQANLLSRPR
jgi:hypothetical protein